MNKETLIFIVSQPRSGSTLLKEILSNSPEVNCSKEETWLLLPFLSIYRTDLNNSLYGSELSISAISKFIDKKVMISEVKQLLENLYFNNSKGVKYVLDKTPRYYEILNEIIECFPSAKIIILRRNPLDVFNSIVDRWGSKYLFDISYFGRDIFNAPILIEKFISTHENNPNVYCLEYEQLVKEPQTVCKNLFIWLDLRFKERYLKYESIEIPVFGDNKIIEHTFPHGDSINQWKKLLNNRKMKLFLEGYINYLVKNNYGHYNLISFKHREHIGFNVLLNYHKSLYKGTKVLSFSRLIDDIKYYLFSKLF